jgi:hypothetical protein
MYPALATPPPFNSNSAREASETLSDPSINRESMFFAMAAASLSPGSQESATA